MILFSFRLRILLQGVTARWRDSTTGQLCRKTRKASRLSSVSIRWECVTSFWQKSLPKAVLSVLLPNWCLICPQISTPWKGKKCWFPVTTTPSPLLPSPGIFKVKLLTNQTRFDLIQFKLCFWSKVWPFQTLHPSSTSLLIESLSRRHSGSWKCNASNVQGHDTHTIVLHVSDCDFNPQIIFIISITLCVAALLLFSATILVWLYHKCEQRRLTSLEETLEMTQSTNTKSYEPTQTPILSRDTDFRVPEFLTNGIHTAWYPNIKSVFRKKFFNILYMKKLIFLDEVKMIAKDEVQ